MSKLQEFEYAKRILEEVKAGFDLRLDPRDSLKETHTKVSQLQVFEAFERRLTEETENVFR